jgi:hypothetical protein
VFDCFDKSSLLYNKLQTLIENGKINNFLPQLYYDQTLKINNINLDNKAFIFYGSPNGLHINSNTINSTNLDGSIAMSIFGGVDRNVKPTFQNNNEEEYYNYLLDNYTWTEICLMNLENFSWIDKVVGTTGSIKHMDEIIDYFNQNLLEKENNINILNKISTQSCSKEHMAIQDAQVRWENNHQRLRSNKVYIKSLIYHFIQKNELLHKFVDKITGR